MNNRRLTSERRNEKRQRIYVIFKASLCNRGVMPFLYISVTSETMEEWKMLRERGQESSKKSNKPNRQEIETIRQIEEKIPGDCVRGTEKNVIFCGLFDIF